MQLKRLSDEAIGNVFLEHFSKQYGVGPARKLLEQLPDFNYSKAIAQAALEDAKRQEVDHLNLLLKHNPIRTGSLHKELGKHIQSLKQGGK